MALSRNRPRSARLWPRAEIWIVERDPFPSSARTGMGPPNSEEQTSAHLVKYLSMRFKAFGAALILFVISRPAHAEGTVTFSKQVVRIFQQHCQTCHRPGNIAPFSLLTYADARPWARAIREAVLLKTMPPWKPVDAHGVFQGERSLTDQEIQTISDWVSKGAVVGAAG